MAQKNANQPAGLPNQPNPAPNAGSGGSDKMKATLKAISSIVTDTRSKMIGVGALTVGAAAAVGITANLVPLGLATAFSYWHASKMKEQGASGGEIAISVATRLAISAALGGIAGGLLDNIDVASAIGYGTTGTMALGRRKSKKNQEKLKEGFNALSYPEILKKIGEGNHGFIRKTFPSLILPTASELNDANGGNEVIFKLLMEKNKNLEKLKIALESLEEIIKKRYELLQSGNKDIEKALIQPDAIAKFYDLLKDENSKFYDLLKDEDLDISSFLSKDEDAEKKAKEIKEALIKRGEEDIADLREQIRILRASITTEQNKSVSVPDYLIKERKDVTDKKMEASKELSRLEAENQQKTTEFMQISNGVLPEAYNGDEELIAMQQALDVGDNQISQRSKKIEASLASVSDEERLELEKEIAKLNDQIKILEARQSSIKEKQRELLANANKLKSLKDAINSNNSAISAHKKQIESYDKELTRINDEINKIGGEKGKNITRMEAEIKALKAELQTKTSEVDTIKTQDNTGSAPASTPQQPKTLGEQISRQEFIRRANRKEVAEFIKTHPDLAESIIGDLITKEQEELLVEHAAKDHEKARDLVDLIDGVGEGLAFVPSGLAQGASKILGVGTGAAKVYLKMKKKGEDKKKDD